MRNWGLRRDRVASSRVAIVKRIINGFEVDWAKRARVRGAADRAELWIFVRGLRRSETDWKVCSHLSNWRRLRQPRWGRGASETLSPAHAELFLVCRVLNDSLEVKVLYPA